MSEFGWFLVVGFWIAGNLAILAWYRHEKKRDERSIAIEASPVRGEEYSSQEGRKFELQMKIAEALDDLSPPPYVIVNESQVSALIEVMASDSFRSTWWYTGGVTKNPIYVSLLRDMMECDSFVVPPANNPNVRTKNEWHNEMDMLVRSRLVKRSGDKYSISDDYEFSLRLAYNAANRLMARGVL